MNAADVIKNGEEAEKKITIPKDMVLVKMKSGASWTTPSGVKFSSQHPFQLVTEYEASVLLQQNRFEQGNKQDLLAYYKK